MDFEGTDGSERSYVHELDAFREVLIAGLIGWVQKSERRPRLRLFSTAFHGKRVPPVKLPDYLDRIMRYANCSPVCYSIAFVIMRKLAER